MVEQHAADTLQPFLDQLREALTAVANGNPEPMKALCSHTDAVSQCGFYVDCFEREIFGSLQRLAGMSVNGG
jgi:hypothetical protein